ncbi:MAG: toll/interleukin-1 receptor domain-containing protein [Firmicutes bacterium]|nr:toll/interleukin-1 receptor domain-containing protein [Bacillota bacterium]
MSNTNNFIAQVNDFISQGEKIMKEEYHVTTPGLIMPDSIGGPKSDQWFNEINIFNSRTLINHPLHNQIDEVCKNHKYSWTTAHEDMMGYLKALASDDVFWREIEAEASAEGRKSVMSYDVFISHANADKIEYVDQLKQSLDRLSISIFYDKDTLKWGDNWKEMILKGIKQAEFAIIVISENFFGREWTEKELNELLNRQNSNGQKIILPILHKITLSQLTEKYPAVADIQALDSAKYTCDEIAVKFAGELIKRLKT